MCQLQLLVCLDLLLEKVHWFTIKLTKKTLRHSGYKLGEILSTDEEQLLAFDEEKKKKIKNLKRACSRLIRA